MLPEEQEFLEKLYLENFSWVFRYIAGLLKGKSISSEQVSDLAKELAQDTFHTASQKVRAVMAHPKPAAWLTVAAKHKFQEYSRQSDAESRWFLPSNDFLENFPDPQNNPSAVLDDMGYADTMERIRKILSEDDFRLFHMVILNRASHKDASKELGITVWASQKRLERIRDKLQKLFSP